MDLAQIIEKLEKENFMSLAGCFESSCLDTWCEKQCKEILEYDEKITLQSEEIAKVIENLPSATQPQLKHQEICMEFFFGPTWNGHALHHKPIFWHKEDFYEPDITKLMARTMSDERKETGRQWLCRSFLLAVCNACQQKQGKYTPPKNNIEVTPEVKCEISASDTKKKGYLDLLFCWGENEERRVIGVEVKFDADTKNNHFKAYEKMLREQAGNQIEPLKILLVKKKRRHDPNWNQVFWQDLLPLWEVELRQLWKEELKKLPVTASMQYQLNQSLIYGAQLRASIINKVYGVRDV